MSDKSIFDNIDKGLLAKFKQYHQENPEVFRKFKAYAEQMKDVRDKYSAWNIISKIRWDTDLQSGDVFKINNDFIGLYARLLIYKAPEFLGFFELRAMKAFDRRESTEERYRKSE